jgi:hypothetical protein
VIIACEGFWRTEMEMTALQVPGTYFPRSNAPMHADPGKVVQMRSTVEFASEGELVAASRGLSWSGRERQRSSCSGDLVQAQR